MAEHTPGPWRLGYGGGYGQGHIFAEDFACGKTSLAAAHFPPDYAGGHLSQQAFDLAAANARLIAAAPELLDACTWLANVECGVGRAGGAPEPGEREAAIEAARAAIAKAKEGGGQ